jgi:6-pyruvoyl-tetrahydropterin synthase
MAPHSRPSSWIVKVKLFVNNLTNVDFSYLHTERGLMGESWLVQLELDGSLNDQGMVCDFGIVKKLVRQWMDSTIDHALVVPTLSEQLAVKDDAGNTEVVWTYQDQGTLVCRSPKASIAQVDVESITPESLASWCEARLIELFPQEVRGLSIRFIPEEINGAFYHYSHGLQQHDGNCQRIAHGHRSKVEIFINGERNAQLEADLAERWKDIYIGTSSHRQADQGDHNVYAYDAPQGAFYLSLPKERCYDITTESTVEQIAQHLAERTKQIRPLDDVLVRAYEGIGKGAVATA